MVGRARWQPDSSQFKYDYFVKDHLGNVRSVVVADPFNAQSYWASYEVANANFENAIFNNVSNISASKPSNITSKIRNICVIRMHSIANIAILVLLIYSFEKSDWVFTYEK